MFNPSSTVMLFPCSPQAYNSMDSTPSLSKVVWKPTLERTKHKIDHQDDTCQAVASKRFHEESLFLERHSPSVIAHTFAFPITSSDTPIISLEKCVLMHLNQNNIQSALVSLDALRKHSTDYRDLNHSLSAIATFYAKNGDLKNTIKFSTELQEKGIEGGYYDSEQTIWKIFNILLKTLITRPDAPYQEKLYEVFARILPNIETGAAEQALKEYRAANLGLFTETAEASQQSLTKTDNLGCLLLMSYGYMIKENHELEYDLNEIFSHIKNDDERKHVSRLILEGFVVEETSLEQLDMTVSSKQPLQFDLISNLYKRTNFLLNQINTNLLIKKMDRVEIYARQLFGLIQKIVCQGGNPSEFVDQLEDLVKLCKTLDDLDLALNILKVVQNLLPDYLSSNEAHRTVLSIYANRGDIANTIRYIRQLEKLTRTADDIEGAVNVENGVIWEALNTLLERRIRRLVDCRNIDLETKLLIDDIVYVRPDLMRYLFICLGHSLNQNSQLNIDSQLNIEWDRLVAILVKTLNPEFLVWMNEGIALNLTDSDVRGFDVIEISQSRSTSSLDLSEDNLSESGEDNLSESGASFSIINLQEMAQPGTGIPSGNG
ncbi:MAG: hypothetical protein WCF65_06740 [Parachlamydiaceae bacterium]